MKFAHLSDLHLGKYVNGFSMLEEQDYILKQIRKHLSEEAVEYVLIAGDIYDVFIPSSEAMHLFDEFLTWLSKNSIKAYIISGNHDSAERLSYAQALLKNSGIHIAPPFAGKITSFSIEDEYGELEIYLLPFLKPVLARHFWPEEKIESYHDAVRLAVEKMAIDEKKRNILLSHQFVTGAISGGSENVIVGGLDNIGAEIFSAFDYVALGHIHRPQKILGKENIRYCGTPLQYSFSEVNDEKGLLIVDLKEKGNLEVKKLPLLPLHKMREVKGTYEMFMRQENYKQQGYDDYLSIVLEDEVEILNALDKLREVYPNIMKLRYQNQNERDEKIEKWQDLQKLNPLQMVQDFYQMRNERALGKEQARFLQQVVQRIFEEDLCDR